MLGKALSALQSFEEARRAFDEGLRLEPGCGGWAAARRPLQHHKNAAARGGTGPKRFLLRVFFAPQTRELAV